MSPHPRVESQKTFSINLYLFSVLPDLKKLTTHLFYWFNLKCSFLRMFGTKIKIIHTGLDRIGDWSIKDDIGMNSFALSDVPQMLSQLIKICSHLLFLHPSASPTSDSLHDLYDNSNYSIFDNLRSSLSIVKIHNISSIRTIFRIFLSKDKIMPFMSGFLLNENQQLKHSDLFNFTFNLFTKISNKNIEQLYSL